MLDAASAEIEEMKKRDAREVAIRAVRQIGLNPLTGLGRTMAAVGALAGNVHCPHRNKYVSPISKCGQTSKLCKCLILK